MARKKKKTKRRRTTSEKVIIVLGIIIALSMILSLVVGLGSGGSADQSGGILPEDSGVPVARAVDSINPAHGREPVTLRIATPPFL